MKCWKCGNELTTGDSPDGAQCRRCEQASRVDMESPEYLIASIDDFLQVPQDRLAACLIEFHDYLAALRTEREAACQAADADDVETNGFVWRDDGARRRVITFQAVP
jgi:hypothetical protein